MADWRVPLFDLDIDEAEISAVEAVLRSKWLTMGDQIAAFESEFAQAQGVPYALAVSNCTAGLHLAYHAVGVGLGDEVIVPSLTFVATANSVIAAGGVPVFADIVGEEDLTMSPEAAEAAITSRTRAICVVHYAGYGADMARFRDIADRHGLALIEDCAHAPGATQGGTALGAWGDVGCFSFFSNKNLATGEGGMLTARDPAIAARLRLLRSHGMTTLTLERHRGHAFSYDVTAAGFNYRMDEIHAALGRVQLGKLARKNKARRQLVSYYRAALAAQGNRVAAPFGAADLEESSCHIMPVLLPTGAERQEVMKALAAERIQSSIHYPPIHHFSYYRERWPDVVLPKTESVASRLLTLPLYPSMTTDQVDEVCAGLGRALAS